MKNYILTFSILSVFLFSACEKEEDISKPEAITNNKWVLKSIDLEPGLYVNLDGHGVIVNEYYDKVDSCKTDEILDFKPNGDYHEKNVIKCDSLGPSGRYGVWHFNANLSMVTINKENHPSKEYWVEKLNEDKLIISYMDEIDGEAQKFQLVYKPE